MRLFPATSLLCVIDVQERLLAVVPKADRVVARCRRLAEAARLLGVRTVLTEQYPAGLGATPAALAAVLPQAASKLACSCRGCGGFDAAVAGDVAAVVLAGLETHVCIAQTALDLLAAGRSVFVVVDAVASRHLIDHETACGGSRGPGRCRSRVRQSCLSGVAPPNTLSFRRFAGSCPRDQGQVNDRGASLENLAGAG